MAVGAIASRYATALFEPAKGQDEVEATRDALSPLGAALRRHAQLRQLVANPGLSVEQKLEVLERVLGRPWSAFVRAFLQMVLAFGRAESLGEIVEAFERAVEVDALSDRLVLRPPRGRWTTVGNIEDVRRWSDQKSPTAFYIALTLLVSGLLLQVSQGGPIRTRSGGYSPLTFFPGWELSSTEGS